MKKFLVLMAVAATLATSMSGCKEEEEEVDLRDQAVGSFTGTSDLYLKDENGGWIPLGANAAATFQVRKHATNTAAVELVYEGDAILCDKVLAAGNGFAFDIPSQTPSTDFTIAGENYWDLGGSMYHGAFISATKTFSFAYFYEEVNDGVSHIVLETVEGTMN